MTTLLKTFEWSDYFSFGSNNKIDFLKSQVTQILGVNGNGKSSIPLILEEVCFNKNSKGISKSDIPNRYLDKPKPWGKLTLDKDGDEYILETTRTSTAKIKLSKNGEDISAHTASGTLKIFEELLGKDFKTFSQLVYQSTNSSLQFLTATDTNRKKFLIDLLSLEDYVAMFDLYKDLAKESSDNLRTIQAKVDTISKWIATNKDADTVDLMEELPVPEQNNYEQEKKVAELSVELANIRKTNLERQQNTKYRDLLKAVDLSDVNAMPDYVLRSYDKEQSELGGLESDARRHKAQHDKLKKLGDSCPTCEQDIPTEFKQSLLEKEAEELAVIDTRMSELRELIETIKSDNKNHEYKAAKIKEFEDLHNLIREDIPEELLDKNEIEATIVELNTQIVSAQKNLKSIQDHNSKVVAHNSRIQVIREQSEKFSADLEAQLVELRAEENNVAELEILKKSFSTNGLLAYKIENMVKDLEEHANEYLAEFSDGRFTIEFSVVSDKLNVVITDNGKVISIAALSSGELARVNTSTLLAIRKLMNYISKSSINVLFLDEVISVLDDQGKEKLVEILMNEPNLNTYLVSHSWSHPLLDKLEVVKEDNISRLEHYGG